MSALRLEIAEVGRIVRHFLPRYSGAALEAVAATVTAIVVASAAYGTVAVLL